MLYAILREQEWVADPVVARSTGLLVLNLVILNLVVKNKKPPYPDATSRVRTDNAQTNLVVSTAVPEGTCTLVLKSVIRKTRS